MSLNKADKEAGAINCALHNVSIIISLEPLFKILHVGYSLESCTVISCAYFYLFAILAFIMFLPSV